MTWIKALNSTDERTMVTRILSVSLLLVSALPASAQMMLAEVDSARVDTLQSQAESALGPVITLLILVGAALLAIGWMSRSTLALQAGGALLVGGVLLWFSPLIFVSGMALFLFVRWMAAEKRREKEEEDDEDRPRRRKGRRKRKRLLDDDDGEEFSISARSGGEDDEELPEVRKGLPFTPKLNRPI